MLNMKFECVEDVLMDFGNRVFTKGKTYTFTKFNEFNGIDSFKTIDDDLEEHLMGRIDEWFTTHFKQV